MTNYNITQWVGLTLKVISILFLMFDALMKIIKNPQAMDATVKLGISTNLIPLLGIMLLVFTVLYAIPYTSIVGLIFITTYLGGATASMLISNNQSFSFLFPVIFGLSLWIAQWLLNSNLKAVLFLTKS